jgi:hypothetical protein
LKQKDKQLSYRTHPTKVRLKQLLQKYFSFPFNVVVL